MEFIYNYIWEKNGRAINEDALTLLHVTKEGKEYLLAVICDGIGGLPEGENASSFVADKMGKELLRLLDTSKCRGRKAWRNSFLRKIYQCHRLLGMYGKEKGFRLGTTLSMMLLIGNRGWIFQVGDSAFFVGKQRLQKKMSLQRTKQGALKYAVGPGKEPQVECKRIRVKKGSVCLLASDGFYQKVEVMLTKKATLKAWKKREIHTADISVWLRNWFKEAGKKGERDNATAICIVCK